MTTKGYYSCGAHDVRWTRCSRVRELRARQAAGPPDGEKTDKGCFATLFMTHRVR
jgi:hypothetical protein